MGKTLQRLHMRVHEGVNYRLRTLAGGRFASHCRPTWIDFLLTERCNSRCCHCDIWQNKGKEESPTADEWKAALTDLRDWLGPVRVGFTGGEALLKIFTVDLLEHASRIGLNVELLTHGYWEKLDRIEAAARTNPYRITLSLDGIGTTHDRVRGREGFFAKTSRTIDTLRRLRDEEKLSYTIRLKTVIMSQNVDDLVELARYASVPGVEIYYQAIEQNYNAPDDPRWFETSANWPRDPERVIAQIEALRRMKRSGAHISNSDEQLAVMIPYFRDPEALRVTTQGHVAHEQAPVCAALELFQVRSNGEVKTCSNEPAVGSIRTQRPRDIWASRPRWWEGGCCLTRRASEKEREVKHLVQLAHA